ncbi:MAG: hypothetical protein AB7N65_27970 [Vicinamibacterales bacterium]
MAAALWATGGMGLVQAQSAPVGAGPAPVSRSVAERQQRYRIATMERVLEGAVEHGASVTRDRLRAFVPADMLLNESARVRGFRLDGYGVFFDVSVPSLQGTLPWTFRVLDQNNLGLDSAVRTLQSFIESSSPNDVDVQQAFRRLVMQVAPATGVLTGTSADANQANGGLAAPGAPVTTVGIDPQFATRPGTGVPSAPRPPADPIMENPQEAYRAEVRDALMDVMLDHSRSLNLGADEWLTVAARSNDDRPRLSPMDNDAQTVVIRVRGADLNAYLAGQISRDDARQRMDVRVF